jgi:transposase
MKQAVAFDVSMGKSMMVIYNEIRQCQFEGEIEHNRPAFERLKETLRQLTKEFKEMLAIIFEATGVYSTQLETFFKTEGYTYSKINPLKTKLQMATIRRQKTDINDAHRLA